VYVCLRREKPLFKRPLRITAFGNLLVHSEEFVLHAYVGGVNRAQNSAFITSKTEKLLIPTMKNYPILWAI